ncbi:MAG: carbon-nitrogen hydrolase family protein [Firmicutes bacterium]|nr:carbon-nitrogen hydrolase family protein [Bacillota bacterium]
MSRKVKIATVSFLIDNESKIPGTNINRALALVDKAAKYNPDLIVFPEEFDIYALSPEDVKKAGEIVPGGPIQQEFAKKAKQSNTNIVIDIREIDGDLKYNTGIVINRKGEYVGKYRKSHLAPGEEMDVRAGDEYPVFELDFGKIGITICMDIHYPEIFRILALQGADIIVHPTMWIDYTGNLCESLVNARAIDNQVYIVTSHYVEMPYLSGRAMGHSRIVDPYGRTRADTGHRPGIAVAEVDLDEVYEYWATGELKKRLPTLKDCFLGLRKPETYGILTRPDRENNWKLKSPLLYAKE